METLQHDPVTKEQIKQAIYEHLYAPVDRQFKQRLDALILQNTVLGKYTHKSFHYKGELYTCDEAPPPQKWNRLVPQLKTEMDAFLADLNSLNRRELPYVLGYVTRILNASNHFGDYLKAFPACLHSPLRNLIATCPCHTSQLPEQKISEINQQCELPITLIKQRMVTNLLI